MLRPWTSRLQQTELPPKRRTAPNRKALDHRRRKASRDHLRTRLGNDTESAFKLPPCSRKSRCSQRAPLQYTLLPSLRQPYGLKTTFPKYRSPHLRLYLQQKAAPRHRSLQLSESQRTTDRRRHSADSLQHSAKASEYKYTSGSRQAVTT